LRHGLGLFLLSQAKQVVEIFDQPDFPRHQARAGQAHECIQVRPGDRLDAETAAPARAEPAKRIPDIFELGRQRRRFELGLELGALLELPRPLDQALQDLPVRDAVLKRSEIKRLFGERPQLIAEG
jgi:hypothetical protein